MRLRVIKRDETGARKCVLELRGKKAELPTKVPTSSEVNSIRKLKIKEPIPQTIVLAGKLLNFQRVARLAKDDYFKAQLASISRFFRNFPGAVRMFYAPILDEFSLNEDAVKRLLDLQYLSGVEVFTLAPTLNTSPKEFFKLLKVALKQIDRIAGEAVFMPVVKVMREEEDTREVFQQVKKLVEEGQVSCVGVDVRGKFAYSLLYSVRDLHEEHPELWVHALQVPPKPLFGRRYLDASYGLILPYFSVDSYCRWLRPPPPFPPIKEKLNYFDPSDWTVLHLGKVAERSDKMPCNCPVCSESPVEKFLEGTSFTVLDRTKAHAVYAEEKELAVSKEYIGRGKYAEIIKEKEGTARILSVLEGTSGKL